ncbi:transposable element Tcb2 transposase [Trichonephila clavipes]|nr:transposable element Tcb2 transposase [Trichonephila clavipes]
MPSLPVPIDNDISRVFIESSALEQVVAIHSGMVAEWAGLISSHAKPVVMYLPLEVHPSKHQLARVSHRFPKLFIFWGQSSIFVNVCGDNALCSSEDQGHVRLSRLGSLLVFLVGSFIAGDPNMTWDPLKAVCTPSHEKRSPIFNVDQKAVRRSFTWSFVSSPETKSKSLCGRCAELFIRLHGGGLFARRPVRCVPLTPAHRRRRSLWCREHRNWRDNEWGRVLFTDESRFSLSSDSHRILIWRERGSRNHPSNIIERDRYGGRGVLVWGGIMLGSRTDLHIFDAGSVNGTRYCNEILLPYVRLFRGAMGLQFLFMDDNAPCHRTVAAEQLLESEDIERMGWPARSPDLNPIEHVWDFLGRRLAARTLPPVTIQELRLALQDEWAAMPQQLIDTLILSMGRRCETCLAVREDHIPY